MLDQPELARALALHDKCYALMRWIRIATRNGDASFSFNHGGLDADAAAADWIERHRAKIADDALPCPDEMAAFARLFVSFLHTGFQLKEIDPSRLDADPNDCPCSFCSWIQCVPDLTQVNPNKRDVALARQRKRDYVASLARQMGIAKPETAADRLLANQTMDKEIAKAAWGAELLQRTARGGKGAEFLVLWRQFAWSERKPATPYRVTAEDIIAAQQRIVEALKGTSQTSTG